MMALTPQQVWEEAPTGAAFLTFWRGNGPEKAPVVWVKGPVAHPAYWVHDLDWGHLEYLIPVTIHDEGWVESHEDE